MAFRVTGLQRKFLRVSAASKVPFAALTERSTDKRCVDFVDVAALKQSSSSSILAIRRTCSHSVVVDDKLSFFVHKSNLVPMSLADVESIIIGCEVEQSYKNDFERSNQLSRIVRLASNTGEDIECHGPENVEFHPALREISCSTNSVLAQNNYPVSIIQSVYFERVISINDARNILSSGAWIKSVRGYSDYSKSNKEKRPTVDQLLKVKEYFIRTLPKIFKDRHEYQVYHPNMVFVNNYWGTEQVYRGITAYAVQLAKLKFLVHIRYAMVTVELLDASIRPEDGTVTVRWRIVGLPQTRSLKLWKFLPWTYRKSLKHNTVWHDGISVFTLGTDGMIHKHRVDRIIPDDELHEPVKVGLAPKLAAFLGLLPQADHFALSLVAKVISLAQKTSVKISDCSCNEKSVFHSC